ncbi:MAG: hydroxyethylthiazole kinase [Eubacteriales bacterium]|nr:hydroxyethylthiazole kinase [Eubacteriales bacterium]
MIEKKRPVVQCITNIVTVNDCANALLAAGASPTMAHHPAEMEDFAGVTDALVCNMGATESLEAMTAAGLASPGSVSPEPASSKAACPETVRGRSAKELPEIRTAAGFTAGTRRRPIVIDPVGCASSGFRREKCLELIYAVHPACIRGNAAEIRALATDHNTARGVDDIPDAADGTDGIAGEQQRACGSAPASEAARYADDIPGAADGTEGIAGEQQPDRSSAPAAEAARYAVRLAGQTGAVIVASGETDYVTDGTRLYAIRGGTKWMTRVTGTGCMLSALMGAYLAVEKTALGAAACCLHMNQCAEQAIQKTIREEGGTGTFHIRLIDAISGPVTAD